MNRHSLYHFAIVLFLRCLGLIVVALAPSASLRQSSVAIIEPQSGCHVVLVGCFHGSPTSANDVKEAMDEPTTDGIVLELCAERCTDLQRAQPAEKKPWWVGFSRRIQKTREKQGWSTAATMALLGGVSGILQSSASGLEPGLEFTTALEVAKERRLDVILADQPVDITLQKLGKIPRIAADLFIQKQFIIEAQSLQRAVFGTKETHLSLLRFLTRSNQAVKDVAGWLAIPVVSLAVVQFFSSQQAGSEVSSNPMIIFDLLVIFVSYLCLTLPATRVILSERDDCLASGIRAACKGRHHVVAVLGLLHVNGVADRLLDGTGTPISISKQVTMH